MNEGGKVYSNNEGAYNNNEGNRVYINEGGDELEDRKGHSPILIKDGLWNHWEDL